MTDWCIADRGKPEASKLSQAEFEALETEQRYETRRKLWEMTHDAERTADAVARLDAALRYSR